jgi:hypothetical protein
MAVAGVVCEGHSDFAILERVLAKIWPDLDEILLLQPILDSRAFADQVVGKWPRVKKACAEAARFERKVIAARARSKPSKK